MFTLKSEPQDKFELLKQGFALYRQSFRLTVPYSLIAAAFLFSPILLLWIRHPGPAHPHTHITWYMAGATLIAVILLSAQIFRLYCFCYQVSSSVLQSIRQGIFKFIPLILLGALYAMIILGGTMLLIIPGIYLTYSLLFSFMLLITGNQKVLQTLITSHRLVQGNWWRTFWMMNLLLLLAIAASLAVFVVVASASTLLTLPQGLLYLFIFLANMVTQACLIPFIFSVALVTLHDLRQRYYSKLPPW